MKGFADEMATAGKPLEDEDFVSYVLAGFDQDYNSFMENVIGKNEISLRSLYSQLLAAEAKLDLQSLRSQSSVNAAAWGCGGYRGRGGCDGGRGGFGRGFGGLGDAGSSSGTKLVSQLCKKTVHTVLRCWKQFDRNYSGEERSVNAAEGGHRYNIDMAWYSDTRATNHITSELDKLVVHEKYMGQEQIHVANCGGMQITHVVKSTLFTPSCNLVLINVLYVPSTQKNFVSIHRFTRDNHVFVEYHPYFFFVKDPFTRKVILRGRCRGGLYPFPSLEHSLSSKCVWSTARPSLKRWHEWLGYPSLIIVQRVLDQNKIVVSKESSSGVMCDACQSAKNHQLPFPKSSSVSKAPLELVFLDVWGPAPSYVRKNNYYMSFIDDYSKFTWIFLLKNKYEVFDKFHISQQHIERLLNRKIISMQTDWGGEYQRLNFFFY
jgi:hypothetical protein